MALLEISSRYPSDSVVTVADIAHAQGIPPRFLEQIFGRLRAGGYVESRRGKQGGYFLSVPPSKITVGEIIRLIEGPDDAKLWLRSAAKKTQSASGLNVFHDVWLRANHALSAVFDETTFQQLVDRRREEKKQSDYVI